MLQSANYFQNMKMTDEMYSWARSHSELQWISKRINTYDASSSKCSCTRIEYCMKAGAHNDNAPATNATHVKPADDRRKLLLQKRKITGFN